MFTTSHVTVTQLILYFLYHFRAFASGDLNFDGKPDLVVSAPGYGSLDSPQEGRVYIVYGMLSSIANNF